MKNALHALALDTFVPLLESLQTLLDRGAAHAESSKIDLVNARLTSDMFTLAQQVEEACQYARNGLARLAGQPEVTIEAAEKTFPDLKAQIARALDFIRGFPASAFEGAEERDCSLEIPGDLVIEMNGRRFLVAWSIPHFFFHVVTAYGIMRFEGVEIGKNDYMSYVGGFIRPRGAGPASP